MKYTGVFITLIILLSCNHEGYYKNKLEVNKSFWQHNDSLEFEMNIEDTLSQNLLTLVVEHSTKYDYQNLYLNIKTEFPDKRITEENLSLDLAEKSGKWHGKWHGKCRVGICKLKVYLLQDFRFPQTGNYRFVINQNTRQDSLMGIKSLELQLEKRNS